MTFDSSYVVYGLAVGWFTYHMFWMAMRIYQFSAFPRTYGTMPNLSLHDLAEAAVAGERELPAFRIVIPAFQEVDVIEATLRRAAAINYPRSHFEIDVVTYEDEPATLERLTTYDVARRVAEDVNREAGLDLIRVLRVPPGFDGFFPGRLDAPVRHIGKARGLNFALRSLHEENERSERALYIEIMRRRGYSQRIDNQLAALAQRLECGEALTDFVNAVFDPGSPAFLGPLSHSRQLTMLAGVIGSMRVLGREHARASPVMAAYIMREASRFFLDAGDGAVRAGEPLLQVIPEKRFLHGVMSQVEHMRPCDLERQVDAELTLLERTRPRLLAALGRAQTPDDIFQLVRRVHARWVMVYDADADPPVDVLRHVAGRIMTEPDVMGLQGPVAPVLNYEDVHPLCRMGALWMAFWHGAAYPRLLHNQRWAHPLAGTNWCFRVDGFEEDGRLIRDCRYDESKRRFLLHFDPTQLTEDLEAGIRNFSEWSINAAWHPLVEMEQVPPTPKTMFRQHARWALGTLQTLGYIFGSRVPAVQKTWFLMYPLRVIFASSGPFVTVALVVAAAHGAVTVAPVFAWWALALAFGNVVYVLAFVRTFERYHDMRRRLAAMDCLIQRRAALLREAHSIADRAGDDAALIARTREQLHEAMKPGGFAQRYLASRCTDEGIQCGAGVAVEEYAVRLHRETPALLQRDAVAQFLRELDSALEHPECAVAERGIREVPTWVELGRLVDAAATDAGVNRQPRWSGFHTQILLWSIPFVYFSVTPFFSAFWRWSRGQRGGWNKTMRTPKSVAGVVTGVTP